jgi:hypothetical protein
MQATKTSKKPMEANLLITLPILQLRSSELASTSQGKVTDSIKEYAVFTTLPPP